MTALARRAAHPAAAAVALALPGLLGLATPSALRLALLALTAGAAAGFANSGST